MGLIRKGGNIENLLKNNLLGFVDEAESKHIAEKQEYML